MLDSRMLHVGLVGARPGHTMPECIVTYVYPGVVEDVHDYVSLERQAKDWMHKYAIGAPIDVVRLHVTGLGSALSSFLKMWTLGCLVHPTEMPLLELAHFDRSDDPAYPYRIQPWDFAFG
tara:strand:+ start:178 stop:537 length:360 start_codon:yes stop_codon:yes gene_type:complete